jgi:hypothetical protein
MSPEWRCIRVDTAAAGAERIFLLTGFPACTVSRVVAIREIARVIAAFGVQ